MHIRSLILGAMLGVLGALVAVPATIVVADLIAPPVSYVSVR